MKKIAGYLCVICGLVAIFSAGNYYSYQSALNRMDQMQEDYESRMAEQVQVQVSQNMDKQLDALKKSQSEAVSQQASTLDRDTIYQIQSYNEEDDTTATDYKALPEDMVGYTRKEAQQYCKDYMQNRPVEEYLKGLQSMDVTAFSNEQLCVKKVYDASKVKYRYYLIASEGEVVVYYGDQKTVYERTGIATDSLSKEERQSLKMELQ